MRNVKKCVGVSFFCTGKKGLKSGRVRSTIKKISSSETGLDTINKNTINMKNHLCVHGIFGEWNEKRIF